MAQSTSHAIHGTTAPRMTSDKNKAALHTARVMNGASFLFMASFFSSSFSIGGNLPISQALVTSDFPHKNEWDNDNLPDILFYLVPPKSIHNTEKLQRISDNGQPVLNDKGRRIRDFEILPRHISVAVEGMHPA